jgi:hypothetical protein
LDEFLAVGNKARRAARGTENLKLAGMATDGPHSADANKLTFKIMASDWFFLQPNDPVVRPLRSFAPQLIDSFCIFS